MRRNTDPSKIGAMVRVTRLSLIFALGLLALVGCVTLTPTPTLTRTPTPTPTPTPTQVPAVLLERINAGLTSLQMEAKTVAKVSRDAKNELFTLNMHFEGDIKGVGDSQMIATMTIDNPGFTGTLKFDLRKIEGIEYAQDPYTGDWEIDDDSALSEEEGAFIDAAAGRLRMESLELEVDSLKNVPVYVLTGRVPDDPEAELVVVWVGADDLLIRQMRVEGHPPASEYEGFIPGHLKKVFQTGLRRVQSIQRTCGDRGSAAYSHSHANADTYPRAAAHAGTLYRLSGQL